MSQDRSSTSLTSQSLGSAANTLTPEIKNTSSMSESGSEASHIVARMDIRSSVPEVSVPLANAQNVSSDQFSAVRAWQKSLLQLGVVIDTQFQGPATQVDKFQARIATLESASSSAESKTEIKSSAMPLPLASQSTAGGATPTLNVTWYFSGENSLRTLAFQVGTHTRQEDFVRLRLPAQTLLLAEKGLKPQAHQAIYNRMNELLVPVEKTTVGKRVVLSGGPGLGKSYCAQHYLYHQTPGQYQLVAWLSGASIETFQHDWNQLANQFRVLDSDLSQQDDNTAIHTWCEKNLGKWLLVIDDANIAPAELEKYLPQTGGHVLLTTRHPNYGLSGAEYLCFSPLDQADSERLVKAHFGRYWSVTGHTEEEQAFKHLLAAMGGYPIALVQAVLLIIKKELSFARFMMQFQDITTRPYMLQDTVFGELRPQQTVSHCWVNAKQQLLALLKEVLLTVAPEELETDLANFTAALVKAAESLSNNPVTVATQEHLAQHGWVSQFSLEQQKQVLTAYQTYLPAYLPISFDNSSRTWQVTPIGLNALQPQTLAITPTSVSSSSQSTSEQKTLKSEIREDNGEKKEGKREMFGTRNQISPASTKNGPSLEATPRPVEMKFSFHDRAQTGHIQVGLYTENSQQRLEKLKQGWKLPRPNPNFIPREKLTQELVEKLPVEVKESKTQQVLLTTAVTGMGGVGKTELARHFITQHPQSQRYLYRFWLDASTPSQLLSEFRQLALYLQLIKYDSFVEDEEMLRQIKKWLSINQGWLLVLDNADQYNQIAPLIPEVGGSVVVTTRDNHPGTLPQERVVKVSVLTSTEALQWLCQLTGQKIEALPEVERTAAEELVAKLGGLPLAIAQAAAYLRANPGITIANYLGKFSTLLSDETLAREAKSEDARARLAVNNTWQLSLQEIRKNATHPEIVEGLLNACAYLAARDIPLFVLEQWLKDVWQGQPQIPTLLNYWLDDYVGQLLRYSLVDRDNQMATLSFHCLIQQVVREKLPPPEQIRQLQQTMHILTLSYPEEDKGVSKEWDDKRFRLLSHFKSIIAHHDQLKQADDVTLTFVLGLLAKTYAVFGNPQEALFLLKRALAIVETHYGQNHWQTAGTLVNLAAAYTSLGNLQEALSLLKRALDIDEAHYGKDHTETVITLVNLASVYGSLGSPQEKRRLLERALRIQDTHGGQDHWQKAIMLANLANVYRSLGNPQEALPLLKRALATVEVHHGQNYGRTADTLVNLAAVHESLGNSPEALSLLEHALKIQETNYGRDHWQTASTLINLAAAHASLGNSQEALSLLERALGIKETHYGKDHWQTASTLNNLAATHGALRNFQEQKRLLERALNIQEAYYGHDHWQTASTLMNLALAYKDLGDPQEALSLLKRALNIQETHYGRDHWQTARTRYNLARTYTALKEFGTAKALLESVLVAFNQHYGPDHNVTQQALLALTQAHGNLLNLKSDHTLSKTEDKTPTTLQASTTIGYFEKLVILQQKAETCLVKGDVANAIQYFETLLKLPLFPDSKKNALHNLACAYHIQSHQKSDEKAWLQAQKMFEAAMTISPQMTTGSTYCEYAQFLYLKGSEQKDKSLLEKTLGLLSQALCAKKEGGLSYNWVERDTLPACLRSLLTSEGSRFEIRPLLLTRYLLVSCYCHLNKLSEAQAALRELEKIVASAQATGLGKQLLTAAQAECTACEELSKESVDKVKVDNSSRTYLKEAKAEQAASVSSSTNSLDLAASRGKPEGEKTAVHLSQGQEESDEEDVDLAIALSMSLSRPEEPSKPLNPSTAVLLTSNMLTQAEDGRSASTRFKEKLVKADVKEVKTDRFPSTGFSTIKTSQYQKLTGLNVVVSSNFGIVVPDEIETRAQPSCEHPVSSGVNQQNFSDTSTEISRSSALSPIPSKDSSTDTIVPSSPTMPSAPRNSTSSSLTSSNSASLFSSSIRQANGSSSSALVSSDVREIKQTSRSASSINAGTSLGQARQKKEDERTTIAPKPTPPGDS